MSRGAGTVVVGLLGVVAVLGVALSAQPEKWAPVFEAEVARAGAEAWAPVLHSQITQESAWDPDARSRFASGLAQFTPPTWGDIAPLTTPSCAEQPETDPACSIRAQIVYDTKLMRRYRRAATPRDRWAFTLAAYNGGPGWISREKRRCQRAPGCAPARWFGHVERHCLRAAWACRENRAYPIRILARVGGNSWNGS